MTAGWVVVALVALAAVLTVWWLALELRAAPVGCEACQGLTDCPTCGPLTHRTVTR